MLVAPVLAIMAWFAIDHFVAEKPHAAKPGDAYSLLARSNCRYDSGQCDLVNGDFELTLRPAGPATSTVRIELAAKHALESATIGLFADDIGATPTSMSTLDSSGMVWVASIDRPADDEATLRVAVVAQGATYYAEIPVVFLRLES